MSTYSIRKKLTDIAKSKVGTKEVGNNTGPAIKEFQRATNLGGTGWAWCAAFVCWNVREWGKDPEVLQALKMTAEEFEKWRPKTAAAYGFEDWAKGAKQKAKGVQVFDYTDELTLHCGDIVSFDNFSHVGIIYDDKNGIAYTIEGNTNSQGSREGEGVWLKERNLHGHDRPRTIVRILP